MYSALFSDFKIQNLDKITVTLLHLISCYYDILEIRAVI